MMGRRTLSVLTALVVVLVAAAASALAVAISHSSGNAKAVESAYESRPITSFVAVSRDGRTLSTFADSGPCGEPLKNRLVAAESAGKVTLTLLVHRLTKAQAGETICATAIFYAPTYPSVRLATPLGHRVVALQTTGRRIPTFGGSTIATPTALPTGCRPGRILPATDILTNGPPYPKGFHPGVTWTCGVAVPFPSDTFGPASILTFGQWQGRVGGVGLPVEMRTLVHGQRALVKVDRFGTLAVVQERPIEWFEHAQTFVITSFTNLQPSVSHTRAVLSAADLIRVADGLRV